MESRPKMWVATTNCVGYSQYLYLPLYKRTLLSQFVWDIAIHVLYIAIKTFKVVPKNVSKMIYCITVGYLESNTGENVDRYSMLNQEEDKKRI